MPRQNRVTPGGDLIATSARGTLMGNRGCLHNGRQEIVRHFQTKRWIICQLQFKNWHRAIMTPGHYTELFFLDEATALAAGHRPCAECSRPAFEKFRSLWALANPKLALSTKPPASTMDEALHRERSVTPGEPATWEERLGALPPGTFVLRDRVQQPYAIVHGMLLAWTPECYQSGIPLQPELRVRVLTPRSIVKTLAQGYEPAFHSSAFPPTPPQAMPSASILT